MARKTKAQIRAMHLAEEQSVMDATIETQAGGEAGTFETTHDPETSFQTSGMDTHETAPTGDEMPVTGLAITTSATAITLPTDLKLKDMVLQDYTVKIANTINSAVMFVDEKNREIARMLADISINKRYVADGFKSVGDYAAKFFGYKKSASYALAAAGEVYLDPKAPEELKAFSPYKLAELSRGDKEKVADAAVRGEIKPNDTVKALREKAEKLTTEATEGVVIQEYIATLVTPVAPMWVVKDEYSAIYETVMDIFAVESLLGVPSDAVIRHIPPKSLEDMLDTIQGMYLWTDRKKVTVTALPKLKFKSGRGKTAVSRETLRYCIGDGATYMVVHLDKWTPKPEKEDEPSMPEHEKPASEMTVEELLALAAKKQQEQVQEMNPNIDLDKLAEPYDDEEEAEEPEEETEE